MRRLTLTFDNGPVPGQTERVLSVLADCELTATFFMVGQRILAPGGREAALRVKAAGHRIGNHTMSHGEPLGCRDHAGTVVSEIRDAEDALNGLTGDELLFRPNGRGTLGPHLLSGDAARYLVANRYTVVTWNCVPRDWEEPQDSWVARAHDAIQQQDWTVLVLHDTHPRAIDHLSGFIERTLDDGVAITSEFARSCVPILEGRLQWPIEGVIAHGYG